MQLLSLANAPAAQGRSRLSCYQLILVSAAYLIRVGHHFCFLLSIGLEQSFLRLLPNSFCRQKCSVCWFSPHLSLLSCFVLLFFLRTTRDLSLFFPSLELWDYKEYRASFILKTSVLSSFCFSTCVNNCAWLEILGWVMNHGWIMLKLNITRLPERLCRAVVKLFKSQYFCSPSRNLVTKTGNSQSIAKVHELIWPLHKGMFH